MGKTMTKPKAATKPAPRETLKVETVSIRSIRPDENNARRHGPRNLASIKASLKRFGQQKPIVVDPDARIIAGNGTYAAAKALGWKSIDIVRTALRGAEARAFALSDNRSGELAEWDAEELSRQLDELAAEDISPEDLSFSDADLEKLLKDVDADGSGDEKGGAGGTAADKYLVVITCADEAQQRELLDRFDAEKLDARALVG